MCFYFGQLSFMCFSHGFFSTSLVSKTKKHLPDFFEIMGPFWVRQGKRTKYMILGSTLGLLGSLGPLWVQKVKYDQKGSKGSNMVKKVKKVHPGPPRVHPGSTPGPSRIRVWVKIPDLPRVKIPDPPRVHPGPPGSKGQIFDSYKKN